MEDLLGWSGGGSPGGVEPPVRVSGPGIVFTESGERIQGVADLRRQLKITNNVSLSTRDGFEIRAPVWVLFTLGEQAEVLKVAYIGGLKAENLQVVTVNNITNILQASSDEIDGIDRAEIHAYAQMPPCPGMLPLNSLYRVFCHIYFSRVGCLRPYIRKRATWQMGMWWSGPNCHPGWRSKPSGICLLRKITIIFTNLPVQIIIHTLTNTSRASAA